VRAAGIAVEVPSRGRPTARLVVLDDSSGTLQIENIADFPADDTDHATQLHDMAEAIRSRLTGLAVDRVVVRRADRPPVPSHAEGPKLRLLAEGAVVSAARSVVVDTRVGTGKETGQWFGSNKEGVDAAAKNLLTAAARPAIYIEATSAALAALKL
jgi:hypothetical protein